jgi:hypothetical protein
MTKLFFKKHTLFCLILIVSGNISASAQIVSAPTSPLTAYGSGVNMRLADMPLVPQDLDHSLYLDDGWSKGDILLENNGIIRACTLRYDIANGYIEIQSETGIRAAPEQQVQQFFIMNDDSTRWFISGMLFEYEKGPISSLMEVLVDEPTQLLLRTRIIISQPNGGFTEQRRAGADAITSVKEVEYYLTMGDQLIDASSKKKMFEAFGDQQSEMKKWAKNAKTKYNDQSDVITLIKHYNSISTEQAK